jgi:3-deoxy-D-manno-octulosonic-acid transferase
MTLLYTLLIHLFYAILWPVSFFRPKIRMWMKGRRDWQAKLKQWHPGDDPVFWVHAASLGEFEQGIPVIEAIKNEIPQSRILLSFFSPSGYEIRKNYPKADMVCYMPLDTAYNAREFIRIVKPQAVFFIKYEFWYFHLRELYRTGIPVYLVSAKFRKNQVFFRKFAVWFRKELGFFNHFFVQDTSSEKLLRRIGFQNVTITGDTRFDRVISNAAKTIDIEKARLFSKGSMCVVAGSTWPPDEALLATYINEAPPGMKFIIAPHEIDASHINRLAKLFPVEPVLFSQAGEARLSDSRVLIIDNIGMLSSLYRYGQIAYIGGGFGKGIHNILEAAVFGLPVLFGPNFNKFREAIELIAAGGAFSTGTYEELKLVLNNLLESPSNLDLASTRASDYVYANSGATKRIVSYLKQ